MEKSPKNLFFILFLCSGATSLLYQLIWMRLAFIYFGVLPQIGSVVISVFMIGLFVGSWLSERLLQLIQRFSVFNSLHI